MLLAGRPAPAQEASPSPAARAAPGTASFEALLAAFHAAYERRDAAGLQALWSRDSPHRAAGEERLQRELAAGLTLPRAAAREPRSDASAGEVRLTAASGGAAPAAPTAGEVPAPPPGSRSLEGRAEAGGWRLWRYAAPEDEAAEALLAATTEAERQRLLGADAGLDRPELQALLTLRGRQLSRQSRWRESLAARRLALALAEAAGDTAAASHLWTDVGSSQAYLGEFDAALQSHEQALALAEQASDDVARARAWNQGATVHLLRGDVHDARELYLKSLAVVERSGQPSLSAGVLGNLGIVSLRLGDFAAAADYTERCAAIYRALGDSRLAQALRALGNVRVSEGDLARALTQYGRALALAEASGDRAGVSVGLNDIAWVHAEQGNDDQAIALLQRSIALAEQVGSPVFLASPLLLLGDALLAAGRREQALDAYQRALGITRERGMKEEEARTLLSLGNFYGTQGDHARALEHYQAARSLAEQMDSRIVTATALANTAEAHRDAGDPRRSLSAAEQAIEVAAPIGHLETLWRSHALRGAALRALGRSEPAAQAFTEAIDVVERLRLQASGGERERQVFLQDRLGPYREMVDLLLEAGNAEAALAHAERSKARVLLDVLQGRRVELGRALSPQERSGEGELIARLRSVNQQVSREALLQRPDRDRLRELHARRDEARHELDAFETRLYAAHPEVRLARGELHPFALDEAEALLPDARTALLHFVVLPDWTHVFLLTRPAPGAPPRLTAHRIAAGERALGGQVQRFRQRLAERRLDVDAPARELYELLLRPLEPLLQGKTLLGVIPDGCLWELPFQALQPRPGGYLIEDRAVFYAPSLSVLREMRARSATRARGLPGSPTLLALGDPAVDLDGARREAAALRGLALGPLPAAADEVRRLARLYGAARSAVYVGRAAREGIVKRSLAQHDVLHLAAHAVLDDASPLHSHVLLSPGGGGAGAEEDGILEAWEVMRLDVRARLVVLSACQTGRGRVSAGEGVVGMAWAFFIAGAPLMVVSQWPVDSSATRDLMVEFHRLLLGRARPAAAQAAALQGAARRLLRRPATRHPFYWAGFTMVGDGGAPFRPAPPR